MKETAKALGIREGNVKVRLLRSRMQLRERLTRTLGDKSRRYQPGDHTHSHSASARSQEIHNAS